MGAAKVSRPVLASAIPRPRLFRRLDRSRHSRVTWLCGPAGAGKSTLVSSYLERRAVKNIWYHLDESDDDPATFFYYIAQASPRRRKPLPLLTPGFRQHLSTFARRFLRELFSRFPSPFVVVLDNYQSLPPASAFDDVLRCMVDELPAHGRLIVVSRSDPPSSLARYRLHQHLDVVAWDELRFTPAEGGRLIRASSSSRWSRDRIRAVYTSADGWGAGLVLLAKHEALGMAVSAPARSGSVDLLFDYFATEVFTTATPYMREVMLQTALLPWVTGAMATKLTGRADAGDVIQYLHRHNFFTNRRPAAESVFEYHPLFRAFLISRAQQSYGAEDLVDVRRRAAGIAEEADLVDGAIDLLQGAEDWSTLAALIGRHAPRFLAQGRGDTVERWLNDLPLAVIEQSAWLLYWRGMCRFVWRHAESQADLTQAFKGFCESGDSTGAYLSWSSIVIAFEAESNLTPLDSWFAEFEGLRERFPTIPSEDIERRVASAVLAVCLHRRPNYPDAPHWAARALELSRSDTDLGLRAISAFNWWLFHFQLGHPPHTTIVEEMRALMEDRDTLPEVAVMASVVRIWHDALTGNAAYRNTTRAMLALTRSTGMFSAAKFGALVGALMGALGDGDLALAASYAKEFEKDLPTLGYGFRATYFKCLVRSALQRHDAATAAMYRDDMVSTSLAAGWALDGAASLLLSAQVHARCGDHSRAQADLDKAMQIAMDSRTPYMEFMCRLVEAELFLNAAHLSRGLEALRVAMKLGAASEYVNTPTWEPQSMSRLCAAALTAGIETEYVRRLITRRQLSVHALDVDNEMWPWPIKLYALGRFEVLVNEKPIAFKVKAQRRPVALLKVLIASGASRVREERAVDLLWPEASGDAGQLALTTTLHRLRRLLGHPDAVMRQDGQLTLNPRLCWVDALALHKLLDKARTLLADSNDSWQQVTSITERLEQLYVGTFLADESDGASWIGSARKGLQTKLIEHVLRVGMAAEHRDLWADAAGAYEFGMKVDSCAEAVCRRLMIGYSKLGRKSDVQRTYERCRDCVRASLDVLPSAETEALWSQLRTS